MTLQEQEEVSIKVHCIVSCFCEVVKRSRRLDYRPYYFGVWDAEIDVSDQGEITYYQHRYTFDYFTQWFERLFGAAVHTWFDPALSREENVTTLLQLMEQTPGSRYVIAQIDLSLMPERENKFHQKPFPHFVLLSKTEEEDSWYMLDSDFRWEGSVSKEQVLAAFVDNPFGGGFYIDSDQIREPSDQDLIDFYTACFDRNRNELNEALKTWIVRFTEDQEEDSFSKLNLVVKQLPVIAIRKYSYEHAWMYWTEHAGLPADGLDAWADRVEELVKGYNSIQYQTIKMAMTKDRRRLAGILGLLEELDRKELQMKKELDDLFGCWLKNRRPEAPSVVPTVPVVSGDPVAASVEVKG